MPQVDFYLLLHTPTRYARNRFVCQLADKAWHQSYRIYIHTSSKEQANELNDLLWTFKPESFLPHDLHPDDSPSIAPIRIGYGDLSAENMTLLINLTETAPNFFKQFQRIAEIIIDTPSAREAGRTRYRVYREEKYELKTHEISRD